MDPETARIYQQLFGSQPVRRKCFISYFAANLAEVNMFLSTFGDVFIAKSVGVGDGDDFINSQNSDYIMGQIRNRYIGDSSVTICLIGSCTHSRRYIDWELKASLRRGETYIPNGLLGITLPSSNGSAHLPARFRENWNTDSAKSYALYQSYPTSSDQLRRWIEEAYTRRTTRANLIKNAADIMKYSKRCNICDVTH